MIDLMEVNHQKQIHQTEKMSKKHDGMCYYRKMINGGTVVRYQQGDYFSINTDLRFLFLPSYTTTPR